MENINSGDISNKKFNSVFRGYDKNEVNNSVQKYIYGELPESLFCLICGRIYWE